MAHTKNTQTHYPAPAQSGDNSDPLSFYLDCADDCTLLVLDINIQGGAARTGGAPTVNGYPLTQVLSSYLCTEVSGEKWFGVWSHFVDAVLGTPTIPGSLEILIPNAAGRNLWGVAHTYKAGLGKVSVFDVSTYKSGTTATANPSGTIYPTDAGGLVTVTAGFGANAVPTSMHTAITTLYSHDPGTYTFFEGYRLLSAVGSVRVMFTMASDDWGWVLAAFKEADAPVLAVHNTRLASSTLELFDSHTQRAWYAREERTILDPLVDQAARQAWFAQAQSDPLEVVDSITASYIEAVADAIVYLREVTDTVDLIEGPFEFTHTLLLLDTIRPLSDLAGLARASTQAATDVFTVFDRAGEARLISRDVLDMLGVTDQAGRTVEAIRRAIDEIAAVADSVEAVSEAQRVYTRSVKETITISDDTFEGHERTLYLLESIVLGDSVTAARGLVRAVGDALGITDLPKAARALQRMAIDYTLLFDRQAHQAWHTALVADRVSLTDQGITQRDRSLSVLEQILLGDTASATYIAVAVAGIYTRRVTDALPLTDSVRREITHHVRDAFGLTDSVTALGVAVRIVQQAVRDTLAVYDDYARQAVRLRVARDLLDLVDVATSQAQYNRAMVDYLALDDACARLIERMLRESLTVTDTIRRTYQAALVQMLVGIRAHIVDCLPVRLRIAPPYPRTVGYREVVPSRAGIVNPYPRTHAWATPYTRTVAFGEDYAAATL